MSRKSKSRHRRRKQRRRQQQAEDAQYRNRGELPPRMRSGREARDSRSRWTCLTARGGLRLGFRPTGIRVPVDFNDPDAEAVLVESLMGLLNAEAAES